MIDPKELAGMAVFAVMFGAFLGYVVPEGSLVGAVAGAGILVILSAIYLVVVPQDDLEPSAETETATAGGE